MKKLALAIVAVAAIALVGLGTSKAEAAGFGWFAGPVYPTYYGNGGYYGGGYHDVYHGGHHDLHYGDVWHDTSHLHYRPGGLQRHGNHFHYVPARYEMHHAGHVDHMHW